MSIVYNALIAAFHMLQHIIKTIQYDYCNNEDCAEPLTGGKMSRASAMCPFRTRVKHS